MVSRGEAVADWAALLFFACLLVLNLGMLTVQLGEQDKLRDERDSARRELEACRSGKVHNLPGWRMVISYVPDSTEATK